MSGKSDIYSKYREIQRARNEKLNELMKEYNAEFYYPAMKQLIEECEKDGGHVFGDVGSNGFGWTWSVCKRCQSRYDLKEE